MVESSRPTWYVLDNLRHALRLRLQLWVSAGRRHVVIVDVDLRFKELGGGTVQ
jgi:hypothetical protein